ncbi:MAG: hypothetical protein Q9184_001213 [Pyrenodesmia sp. 2 TL-2023]
MTGNTLDCLTQRQAPGLKKLRIDNYYEDREFGEEEAIREILGIDSLTISTGISPLCLADFLFEHWATLDCLCLTAELEELRSTGGLGDLPNEDFCNALMKTLDELIHYYERDGETCTPVLRLSVFQMKSIDATLTHLSVLLEGQNLKEPLDISQVLNTHGKSLKSSVWDERPWGKDFFVPSASQEFTLPACEHLQQIANKCPNLVELGISLDWRNLIPNRSSCGWAYNPSVTTNAFRRMTNLRSLNIRNIPFVNPKDMMLPLGELQAGFANSALKTLLCEPYSRENIDTSASWNFTTLAIGAMTYRDIYKGLGCSTCKNEEVYRFLRFQVYKVYRCDFEGHLKPLVVPIESGTYEKTEVAGGDIIIFKPYWLS